MNEMEVEKALDALAESASATPGFLHDFPAKLMAAYQASPSQISRLIKDNDARAAKIGNGDLLSLDGNDMDFIWPKQMHYRSASTGAVHDVVDQLAASQKPKAIPGKTAPRFMLSTDGHAFAAIDLRTTERFKGETLADLVTDYDFLQPMFGVERYTPPSEQEADVNAARHMREIHDAIVAHDPRWTRSEHAEALNTFMIRLLFCLFADGSGVFPPRHGVDKPFARVMNRHATPRDGSDTRSALEKAFQVLDMPADDPRRDLRNPGYVGAVFADLPYANGKLFEAALPVPSFNGRAQRALRRALDLDWGEINADIFGSMIQAIAGEGDRSHFGMHYTSVPNIMKVLGPLFVNPLKEQLAAAGTDRRRLQALIDRIADIHVFDPACGSGNFLIIAYRELRAIETAALATIHGAQMQAVISSKVRLDHFHGIDPVDFACRTARLSLWISQIQADRRLAEIGVEPPAILPLHDAGDIRQASALDIEWTDVVPNGIGETYIVGNPPYLGSTYQSAGQKADMDRVFAAKLRTWRNLDFVAAWFALAAEHIAATGSQAAFVSTNSICQGEQVPTLWPWIGRLGIEIGFAHTSFKWSNLAANKAGVACAIVGLRRKTAGNPKTIHSERVLENGEKELVAREVRNISPYLIPAEDLVVERASTPLNSFPPMQLGNIPIDGGHLLMDQQERDNEIQKDPRIASFIHPIAASRELIRGIPRFCLWIPNERLNEAIAIPSIIKRINGVRDARLQSPASSIRDRASTPHKFGQIQFDHPLNLIAVPMVFSEDRSYMTVSFFEGFITNKAFGVANADPWVMAILSTSIHLLWAKTVGGRMKEDVSYASTLVYNTFPLPDMSDERYAALNELALRIIETRQPYLDDGRNMAWLYNLKTMPRDLQRVHDELDAEFEHMYIRRRFKDDAERLEHMFRLYAKMKGKK